MSSCRLATLSLVCLVLSAGRGLAAEPKVAASILADRAEIAAGDSFRVGVLLKIPPSSHIYWLNPGDSGLPTSISWVAPAGIKVEELAWPAPTAIHDDVLGETYFGYEHEVLLFSNVQTDKAAPAVPLHIEAKVDWLLCLEDSACIPGRATLGIDIPIAGASTPSAAAAIFDVYAAQTPRYPSGSDVPASIEARAGEHSELSVHLGAPWQVDLGKDALVEFFPSTGGAWKRAATGRDNGGSTVVFVPAKPVDDVPSGTLRLPVKNTERGETKVVYLRVEK